MRRAGRGSSLSAVQYLEKFKEFDRVSRRVIEHKSCINMLWIVDATRARLSLRRAVLLGRRLGRRSCKRARGRLIWAFGGHRARHSAWAGRHPQYLIRRRGGNWHWRCGQRRTCARPGRPCNARGRLHVEPCCCRDRRPRGDTCRLVIAVHSFPCDCRQPSDEQGQPNPKYSRFCPHRYPQ